MGKRCRYWCFTRFNPPDPEEYQFPLGVQYASFQLEQCPETQRLHWQGYLELESPRTLSYFRKWFEGFHCTPKYDTSTREQARAYTRKEASRVAGPWEFGEFLASDEVKEKITDVVARLIKEGKTFDEVFDLHPGWCLVHLRQIKELIAWREFSQEKPELPAFLATTWDLDLPIVDEKKRHFWIWSSEPSLGKTENANRWLDTYGGLRYNVNESFQRPCKQRLVVIDEYNEMNLSVSQLDQICDGNFQFTVKGESAFMIRLPIVIVLSNNPMNGIYKKEKSLALLRSRFVEIKLEITPEDWTSPNSMAVEDPKGIDLIAKLTCDESLEDIMKEIR